jgi:hypothetical protein
MGLAMGKGKNIYIDRACVAPRGGALGRAIGNKKFGIRMMSWIALFCLDAIKERFCR